MRTVDRDGVVRIDAPGGSRSLRVAVLAAGGLVAAGGVLFYLTAQPPTGSHAGTGAGVSGSHPAAAATSARPVKARGLSGGGRAATSGATPAPGAAADSPEDDLAGDDDDPTQPVTEDGAGAEPPAPGAEAAAAARGPLGMPAHGSKKIKVGLVVPEGFELPEGYVRHYQTTDKGQMLPAILMFHPDFTPRDAEGRELPVPADRVVPPDLAPEGMPRSWLDVPKDAYSNPDEHDPPTAAEKAAAEEAADEEEPRGPSGP